MERLSLSFHCPWLSVVAVLVVVGSIPPGDFFFVFGQICCFGGQLPCSSAVWVHPKKRLMGIFPWVREIYLNAKNRAPGVENDPFCSCRFGSRGRFWGRTGRFEPPHVTQTSGNVALGVWRSQIPQVPSHWAVKRVFWWLRCQKVAVLAETGRTSKKRPKKAQNRGCLNGSPQ